MYALPISRYSSLYVSFCIAKLSEIELAFRVMWKGYFAIDNKKKWSSFIWVDRDTRYFISNTSYLKPGMPYARDTLREL